MNETNSKGWHPGTKPIFTTLQMISWLTGGQTAVSVEAIAPPSHLRLVAPNIDTMVRRGTANVGDSFLVLIRSVWSETVETTGEGWKQLPLCQDYKTSAPMTSSGLALPHTQIGVEQPQPLVNNDPLSFGSLDKFPKSAFNVRFTTWGCCKFLYAQKIYYIDV